MTWDEFRFNLLRGIGALLYPRYRFKWPQMDWLDHAAFNEFMKRFPDGGGLNSERQWILAQLMRLTEAVQGDTAECGVYKGAGSYLICTMNTRMNNARCHHIFDSFEGLSEPGARDGSHWSKGVLACGEELVRNNLHEFSNVEFHKGWIPESFAEVADRRFAFVHIDVDLYQPTRDSLQFFYPLANPGAVIICDDYGFGTCPGATQAVDEVLHDKPEKMIALPGGGGFLIKGLETSAAYGLATP